MRRVKRNRIVASNHIAGWGYAKVSLTTSYFVSKAVTVSGESTTTSWFSSVSSHSPTEEAGKPPQLLPLLRFWQAVVQLLSHCLSSVIVATSPSGILWIAAGLYILLCCGVSGLKGVHYHGFSFLYRMCHTEPKHTPFFLLFPHMPLLVLFKGILNRCFLCASTRSHRFSITKALNQRMWYQGKDGILFLFTERRKLFCFHDSQKTNPTFLSKQNEKKKIFILNDSVWIKKIIWRDCLFEICISWENKKLFLFE